MIAVRIASLLPGATEIAAAVGLVDELVAVTFECGHPAGIRERLPVVVDITAVGSAVADRPRPRVLVLEWTDPPFLAGHRVPELVRRAGGGPVAGVEGGRSVTATWDELTALALALGPGIDTVLVAPSGYDLAAAVE